MGNVEEQKKLRVVQGRVVSDKMEKTRVILVETLKMHPIFKKAMRRSRKIHVHDENNDAKLGDLVQAVETRPLSKLKRHRLLKVMERAK